MTEIESAVPWEVVGRGWNYGGVTHGRAAKVTVSEKSRYLTGKFPTRNTSSTLESFLLLYLSLVGQKEITNGKFKNIPVPFFSHKAERREGTSASLCKSVM